MGIKLRSLGLCQAALPTEPSHQLEKEHFKHRFKGKEVSRKGMGTLQTIGALIRHMRVPAPLIEILALPVFTVVTGVH